MLLFKYSRDLWSSAYWPLVWPVGFHIWSPWGSGHPYFLQTWHFTNIQRESLSPAHSTFTPVSMPVVETLKSRYANISGVGGLYSWGNLFLGKSSAMKKKKNPDINQTHWNMKIIALQLVFYGFAMDKHSSWDMLKLRLLLFNQTAHVCHS